MDKWHARVDTFGDWRHPVYSINEFATAGFKFDATTKRIVCDDCNGSITIDDLEQASPWELHTRKFNRCVYVQHPPSELFMDTRKIVTAIDHVSPQYPHMISPDRRYQSFNKWQGAVNKVDLVNCGFYALNVSDGTTCFHCGVGLHNWLHDDDPWIEHFKWSPNCEYLRLVSKREHKTAIYINSDQLCRICMDQMRQVAYVPCGHAVACAACGVSLETCPICYKRITQILPIKFS